MSRSRIRRISFVVSLLLVSAIYFIYDNTIQHPNPVNQDVPISEQLKQQYSDARIQIEQLAVKGRAAKTGYTRDRFGQDWTNTNGCDTRNIILHRDLTDTVVDEECLVTSGVLDDPYSGKIIYFQRAKDTSAEVQIDHVVALSDAWQKGAQQISYDERVALANDPLNLLAVSGDLNQQKSDSDAASWLPPYKPFRCQYVARQVLVKKKYSLWVTQAEKNAILEVLSTCGS